MSGTFRIKLALMAILVVTGGLYCAKQRHRINQYRESIERLTREAAKVARLEAEIESMQGIQIDPKELDALRTEVAGLPKLRAEVRAARRIGKASQKDLEDEIERTQQRTRDLVKQMEPKTTTNGSSQNAWLMGNFLGGIVMMKRYHQRVPISFEDFEQMIRRFKGTPNLFETWLGSSRREGRLPKVVEVIEFVPGVDPARHEVEVLVVREREPRRTPDGRWVRLYGTTERDIVELSSDDGDFSEAEQEHARRLAKLQRP